MRERILHLIERFQIRDFGVVFLGRGVGGLLNVLFLLLAARILGGEQFGLFAVAITVMQIASQFAGQGMDTALVRLYVLHANDGSDQAKAVLRSCLKVRVLLTVATVALGMLGAEIYVQWAGRPEFRLPLAFGFAGCALMSFWQYLLAVLQAREQFVPHSLLAFGMHFSKILMLGALVLVNQGTLVGMLGVNTAALALGVTAATMLMPRDALRGGKPLTGGAGQVFGYGRWVIMSSMVAILYSRLDVMVLSGTRGAEEVGYYAAVVSMITGFDLVITALFTVFLPSASRIRDYADTIEYVKFSSVIAGLVLIVPVGVYLLADPLIALILGEEYAASAGLLRIMLPGFMVYLFTFPWALVIYSYNLPHMLFMTDLVVLTFNVAVCLIFIPRHGMEAAAWVNLTTRLLNSSLVTFLMIRESRKLRFQGSLVPAA